MSRITVGGVVVRDVGVATQVEMRQGEQVRISFDLNLGTEDAPQPADLTQYDVDCRVEKYYARSVIGAQATGLAQAAGAETSLVVTKDAAEQGRAWVLVPKDLDTSSDLPLDAASGLPVYAGFVRFAEKAVDGEIDFAPIMIVVRKGIV